jgi:hypothetical protein
MNTHHTQGLLPSAFTFPTLEQPSFGTSQTIPDNKSLDEETDTFEVNLLGGNSLSLSSQLRAIRGLFIPNSSLSAPTATEFIITVELPTPAQTHHLLGIFFRDFDSFFPMLNRRDIECRIFQALSTLEYRENHHTVRVDHSQHSLIAMFAAMIAIAACLDCNSSKTADGAELRWVMYHQGCKLIQHVKPLRTSDLDTIRYHVLTATYLMHSENLMLASQALLAAINLATATKLNEQAAWSDCSPAEQLDRQKLWWTMYFLDRRLGQKGGRAYFIRDSEVAVSEFSRELAILPTLSSLQSQSLLCEGNSSPSYDYFQVLINLGKIWGLIWDKFFAAAAPCRGEWQEIEIMDARILLIRHLLPPHLTWNTEMVSEYIVSREQEPLTRRRLTIYVVSLSRTV